MSLMGFHCSHLILNGVLLFPRSQVIDRNWTCTTCETLQGRFFHLNLIGTNMKKLAVASAVLAALTTSAAFASISVDVYSDRSHDTDLAKQGVELGYSPIENLALTAEATTNKDLDLGVAYTFDIADNFYVKPSAGYVVKWGDKKELVGTIGEDFAGMVDARFDSLNINTVGHNSNVLKVGLETGAKFGDFFTSARYRYERDMDKTGLEAQGFSGSKLIETRDFTTRGKIGRTDLLVGYNFGNTVTLTAKGIHRSQLDSKIREGVNFINSADKDNITGLSGNKNSYWTSEIKATLTSYEGVLPYVQYSRNYANKDDMIKLGAKFVF